MAAQNMTTYTGLYSEHYFSARQRFLAKAHKLGLPVETDIHPLSDEFYAEVATDSVRIGPDKARYVLFVTSGVHGTELTAGSGPQLEMLEQFKTDLPEETALVLVHAVNAYGSACLTRTDENNVDPNRNIRPTFDKLPPNPAYDGLHAALCPKEWSGKGREAADAAIAHYVDEHGMMGLTQKVLQGQYTHPDGLFYGGREESWCVSNLTKIVRRHGEGAEQLAILDLHTGVGPYGFGEVMRVDRPAPADVEWENIGGFVCDILDRVETKAPPIKVLLEFGTFEFNRVLNGLRGDNWLRHHGELHSPQGREIKRALRDALFSDEEKWLNDIASQSVECCRKILEELTASDQ